MAGVPLDYVKTPTGGNIAWFWIPSGGITDVDDALITELNPTAGYNLSDALTVGGTDFGMQASDTNSDPSFGDTGNVQFRGAANYGGGTEFFYPANYDDDDNLYSVAYDLTDTDRVDGFWAVRIDGETPNSGNFTAGQYVSIYQVMADAESDALGGSEAQKRTVNWLNQGSFSSYTVTRSGAAALVVPTTATPAPGDIGRFEATLNGRYYGGVEWSSDDPDVIVVYPGGFYTVTGSDTDTATVTATANGLSDSIAITVTA